ncbi:phosphotransferase enzyme family protein [Streptomyces sp. WI04-05B]|uniref:phosphotransferase enzyme family protein n=1 Tax=Streptomyces TaxID=1883 RepID=UPI0029B997CD|nr:MULTISPECIES: phosphotransferase [unclassified Streptomyces]MDX2547106.1 phosphotransferase [Streptomyces sp. WI04-05B]MDX2581929.1 phosphotransferase [Streptomyces sp. WI04-05A]
MRDAADLIAETYTLGAGPWTTKPVTRGALGQIWKLSGEGSSWAIKELLFGCDEEQVQREAALRQAAESLGIASPRLLPNRHGSYVSHLPPSAGGSYVKLYDWIDGTTADASDPDILDWFGRTTALLHQAGEGASEAPHPWYEQCPRDADWQDLHRKVHEAGLPWADALGRFIATSAPELAQWVTPCDPDDLVTSHRDLQPQNVLVGSNGPVLLDWDNAGPVSAERELASAVYVWAGRDRTDLDAARRLARSYRNAGGRAAVKGPQSFSMLFATELNFIHVQAECAIDPSVTAAQREFAGGRVVASLRSVPDPAAVFRLAAVVEAEG